jgi:ADP-ribose pyrophosphatase YjhB (NUDIX family)
MMDMLDHVECGTLYNSTKLVPRTKLVFRPAVYGLVIHDGTILLITVQSTGKLGLPGGAVELGERLEDALKREMREETGLEVEVERLALFNESFWYYDPLDEAFHALQFFYICRPTSFEFASAEQIEDAEASQPQWFQIDQLRRDDFQEYSKVIFDILQTPQ